MNRSKAWRSWLAAGCVLVLGACTKTLVIDDGEDNADAGPGPVAVAGSGGAQPISGNGAEPDASAVGHGGATGSEPDGGGDDRLPPPDTRWTGNPADCPASRPEHEGLCEVAEAQVCAYFGDDPEIQGQSFYSECACRAFCGSSATERHWDCYQNVGSQRMDCPAEQPEHRSSCFGLKGYQCYYPTLVTCTCPTDPNDSDWRCEDGRPPQGEHPTVVDPDKLVRDMSDEDRAAWCEWYAAPEPGFPPPPELEPNADGFYPDTGYAGGIGFLGCNVCRPTGLPVSACVANLALSECQATVRDLNDCSLSMKFFQPSPYGCARYLDAAGCDGTIVNGGGPDSSIGGFAGASGTPDAGSRDGCLVRVR